MSGLLHPSNGKIRFGDRDVTHANTRERNIAQVFQFPVVYDSMTVAENLAFPLRNRGIAEAQVQSRVAEVAEMLHLSENLSRRANNLSPDEKQIISLGRGLVRSDVAAILFDEPLTVIDPQHKWHLREQLRAAHRKAPVTMVYVTHDQTEALALADEIVVMKDGEILQIGTPEELHLRPAHTFVGYFVGSPGLNVMPARVEDGAVYSGQARFPVLPPEELGEATDALTLGLRPEAAHLTDKGNGPEVEIRKVTNAGHRKLVECGFGDQRLFVRMEHNDELPASGIRLGWDAQSLLLYRDDRLIGACR